MTSNGSNPNAVEINLDLMTIGDLELFDEEPSMKQLVALLDRIVVGGARHRPVGDMRQIIDRVKRFTLEMADPN